MKRKFITVTVFVSSLILSPIFIAPLNANTQIQSQSISTTIASILHKRGIEEDAAQNISQSFIGEDEELFSLMLRNLINGCSELNQNKLLDILSSNALYKQKIDLTSYSSLISIVQKVTNKPLNKKIKQELENISEKNSLYFRTLNA